MIWPYTSEVHAHGKSSYIIYNCNVAGICHDVGIYTMLFIKSPVRDHRIVLERAGNDMMKYDYRSATTETEG